MKKTILYLLLVLVSSTIMAQSNADKAKMAYFEAEEAFNSEQYEHCLTKIRKAEFLIGQTNPKLLELKIKAYCYNNEITKAYESKKEFFKITDNSYPGYNNILKIASKIDNNAFIQFKGEGETSYKTKDYVKAIGYLNEAFAIENTDFNIAKMLGQSYYEISDYKKAIAVFEKAHNLQPSNMEILKLLAYTHYEDKDLNMATFYQQEYVNKDPNNYKEIKFLAELYDKIGNNDKAGFYNQKAFNITEEKRKKQEEILRIEREKIDKWEEVVTNGYFVDERDNKQYKVVKIGNQVWMAENLNFVVENSSWCYENEKDNCIKWGRLYDWENANLACPVGWHLPSKSEWLTLINKLGNGKLAGESMKSSEGWKHKANGNNSSGFNALPGGFRYEDGKFGYHTGNGYWWTSTSHYSEEAIYFRLSFTFKDIRSMIWNIEKGLSVRCIRNDYKTSKLGNSNNVNTDSGLTSEITEIDDLGHLPLTFEELGFEERNRLTGIWKLHGHLYVSFNSELIQDEDITTTISIESTDEGLLVNYEEPYNLIFNGFHKQYEYENTELANDEFSTKTQSKVAVKLFKNNDNQFEIIMVHEILATNNYAKIPARIKLTGRLTN